MRVTVGVSGGIAAYKAAELVRSLQRAGVEVHVVMTESACRFVQPLTFASLTGHKVITGLWDEAGTSQSAYDSSIEHISEAAWCDALVVAPATASILAKFAHGLADDFLSTMYLATRSQVVVAPAMNTNMWEHPATQANLTLLRERGVRVVAPGVGPLACGTSGAGRMAEPDEITEFVLTLVGKGRDLAGETVLVTAGGTREALDPVRYIGNRSSGKMGYALAEAAQSRGARVILISGPSALYPPCNCEVVKITSAEEMRQAVLERMPEATIVIKAAAVADFRPQQAAVQKIKRKGPLTLELAPTEDILAEVVRHRRAGQLIVGFAAETENTLQNGRSKLLRKGADAIVLNDVSNPAVGFDADNNAATFLTALKAVELPVMHKRKLADRILNEILALRQAERVMVELDEGPADKNPQEAVLRSSTGRQLVIEE